MAWIRLNKSVIVNSNKLRYIAIKQAQIEGISYYYLLFSIDKLTTFSSKNFKSYADCEAFFNKLCNKLKTENYIDIEELD